MNGTLRDDENQICQNCGGVGHRKYDCPEQRNFTANIICRVCGSAGHMARDCTVNRDPNAPHPPPVANTSMALTKGGGFDSEYASLMAELGEGGKGSGDAGKPWTGSAGHDITAGGSNIPPWRRPEVWQTSTQTTTPQQQNAGYRPQAGYGGAGAGGGGGYGAYGGSWGGQGQAAPQGYGQANGYYPQQDYGSAYAQYYQAQYSQQQAAPTQ